MESSTTTVESTRAFRGERPVNKKPGMSLRSLFDILVVSAFRTFTNFCPHCVNFIHA